MRKRFEGKNPAIQVGSATSKLPGSNFYTENTAATFTVKHFAGEVDYPIKGLVEENGEVISGDLLNLINSTKSDFVARLFGQEALQTIVHPQERGTIMQASVSSRPMRAPSVMSRRHGRSASRPMTARTTRQQEREKSMDTMSEAGESRRGTRHSEQGASGQFLSALENVTKSFTGPNTNCYLSSVSSRTTGALRTSLTASA